MAEVEPERVPGSHRGRGRGPRLGHRRPQTWEISDSDAEGAPAREVGTPARSSVGERRAAAKALRADQVLERLVVCVDPAVLEDAGSEILMEALGTLGCECRIEPQHQARSLQWSVVRPDPALSNVPQEGKAENEQEQLLLLEPQEFLQGAVQLTQMTDPPCSVPWLSPESPTRSHLAVIGLDAYLWYHLQPQRGGWGGIPGKWIAPASLSPDPTWPGWAVLMWEDLGAQKMVASVQFLQAQFSEDVATKEVRGSPRQGSPGQGSHQLVRGGGGSGAASAPCKLGCAAGSLVARAESVCVCLHQGPRPAPL